ncbi:unnamed protein product [Medioppia subpectinata]|uniref:Uncharacterized protein n=1 Tax=Medioppia subpectinata TaxID=1979941 RepID=A0A7R9PUW5_9ACAR|nr:unnamed protein product [Medioppia subpectinata]CAG2101214.1 unnamed protein product [Medioppia subpectinata]
MSCTASDDSDDSDHIDSQDVSLYATPMTSLNTSLVGSTRIDSSLFDTLSSQSTASHAVDGSTRDSMPPSVATDSTLRPTLAPTDDCLHTTDQTHDESSLWFDRQSMSTFDHQMKDMKDSNRRVLLKRLVCELNGEHMELMAIQHQMQSLSIRCKTIGDNIVSKTNFMNSLINDMIVTPKPNAHKETQTDLKDIDPKASDRNKCASNSVSANHTIPSKSYLSVMSDVSESENPSKSDLISNQSNDFSHLSDQTKNSFTRLPALVKGYLTRRLMKTEKVMQKIDTIREITQLLATYHNIPIRSRKISHEDINFHKRLIIQLQNSCREFYDIFFSYSKSAQMALICRSREQILDRYFRMGSVLSNYSHLTQNCDLNSSQTKPLSSATKRVLERKTHSKDGSSQPKQSHKKILSPKPIASTSSSTVFRDTKNLPKNSSRRSLNKQLNKNPQTVKRNITFIKK